MGKRHQGNSGFRSELSDDRRSQSRSGQALRHAAGRRVRRRIQAYGSDNMTVRTVFVIGPDKKIKLMLVYPMTTGRNFPEILRVIDSLQLTAAHKVATPANWQSGEDVIIVPSVSDAD